LGHVYPNKEMRDNYLKALEFRYPKWIPCSVNISPAAWKRHREGLEEVVDRHPWIFGQYERGSRDFDEMPAVYRKGERYTDNWGCVWYNLQEGIEGQVVKHPLEDWGALDCYKPPDFLSKTERGDRNWEEIEKWIRGRRGIGLLAVGDGERLFDRLYLLRGFGNLMVDIQRDDPHLLRLVKALEDYEMGLVKKWLEIGVDMVSFHTDVGTQRGLMISPANFRKYFKPTFNRLFAACRESNAHVYLSSDGRLLDIVDDLKECGVSVHDPQIRANTLEGIVKAYKGKMCVDIDLDRQAFPFYEPEDIRSQIKEVVEELYLPEGGLMMKAEIYGADIALGKIEAICQAMEDFCIGRG